MDVFLRMGGCASKNGWMFLRMGGCANNGWVCFYEWVGVFLRVAGCKIKAKLNANSSLSNLIAELSLRTIWYTICCTS